MEALKYESFEALDMFELKWPLFRVVVSLEERKENYKVNSVASWHVMKASFTG